MGTWKTKDEYDNVKNLYNDGMRICDIVKVTGLKRSCISNWINRGLSIHSDDYNGRYSKLLPYNKINNSEQFYEQIKKLTLISNIEELNACYSYLFGLYLGDGLCRDIGRSHVLVYSMDNKYMDLVNFTKDSVYKLFGKYPTLCDKRLYKYPCNCFDIKLYTKSIRAFFPQGENHGVKHLRKINIEQWQYDILNPLECIRGLIYSDGSFIQTGYRTFRYEFSNCSFDIINLFKYCCDKLNLRYNCHQKKTLTGKSKVLNYVISIAIQDDVRWLMRRIGYKDLINIKYNIKNKECYYESDKFFSLKLYERFSERMKTEWICSCCKKECFSEDINTYYLNDKLWLSINDKKFGMICLECLHNIIKRDIILDDLKDDNTNKFLNPKLKRLFDHE